MVCGLHEHEHVHYLNKKEVNYSTMSSQVLLLKSFPARHLITRRSCHMLAKVA